MKQIDKMPENEWEKMITALLKIKQIIEMKKSVHDMDDTFCRVKF